MMGAAQGYSGILLPQLRLPQSSIQITDSDASWIGKYRPMVYWDGSFALPHIINKLSIRSQNLKCVY